MERSVVDELHLHPRTDAELHAALNGFEQKWQYKAGQLRTNGRASRF